MLDSKTPERIATSVKFHRSQPKNSRKGFLLVEGKDDFQLFSRFIDRSRCFIDFAGDKQRVIKSISILESQNQVGVLGIVDAEFDILLGRGPTSPNIVFTDSHDIEAMIISSRSYDDYIESLVPRDKLEVGQRIAMKVRKYVVQIARPVGMLRYISDFNRLYLSLNGFNNFIDQVKYELMIDDLIYEAIRLSRRDKPSASEVTEIRHELEKVSSAMLQTHEWYFYRGHDLTELTVWAITAVFKREFPDYDLETKLVGHADTRRNVEMNLRRTYDSRYFRATNLYVSIRSWETKNSPYQVLDNTL
jgi:hypothetical protein